MPPFLKPHDPIGIVSNARYISQSAVEPVKAYLSYCGFQVKLGNTIGKQWHQFAGNDATRAADLQSMLDDPDIHAILMAKGGYGTIRILDRLNWDGFKKAPKWITGFSDVTVLHSYLNERLGIPTIHGPLANVPEPSELRWQSMETLYQALTGQLTHLQFTHHPFNQAGECIGRVAGGNLSILYSLLGSPEAFEPRNTILLLEEVDEYLYHLDRMLWSLRRANKLDGLAGVIIGGMTDMKDNPVPFGSTAEELLATHLRHFKGPIAFGLPIGHLAFNQSCYLGVSARLSVSSTEVRLTYQPSGFSGI